MNKDELKGKGKQIKGQIKQEIGARLGKPELVSEGDRDRTKGEVQQHYGKARRQVGEAIEKVARKIKR